MISTRVLLLFAAPALICIAGYSTANEEQPTTKRPGNCGLVSNESFDRLDENALKRNRYPVGLGNICEIRFHKGDNTTKCIGYGLRPTNGPACIMCCACRNGDGIVRYNATHAPNTIKCGRG
uniref:Putative ixostatin n=1 Tax=Ixodes ricinus TaxID=34613 RepID=A0A0K8RC90_IXORI